MYFESGADILDAAMDALGLGRVGSLSSAYGAPKESDARTLFAYVKNQEYAHRWPKGQKNQFLGEMTCKAKSASEGQTSFAS